MAKEYQKIYEDLLDRIIWLDLMPESVLNVSELAEYYGVSRTPVKEALIFLQAEGWLLRQGTYFLVTPLSLDRIKEITDIRLVLESQANLWASQRITGQQMARLKALKAKCETISDKAGTKKIVELDSEVHRVIYQASRNMQLAQNLDRLLFQYLRFWLSIPREIQKEPFLDGLSELIDAIESRDESYIIQVSQQHILGSVQEIMLSFSASPLPTLIHSTTIMNDFH